MSFTKYSTQVKHCSCETTAFRLEEGKAKQRPWERQRPAGEFPARSDEENICPAQDLTL